ncbi:OmpA family protein [Colwellia sp. 4_MG-2023]|jgi:outer membrane protein OmpA-like peptidoglycan-associated protein|uniref:OmpA family protein n=1 Tax=unclassified Colwellia TaxID=196834 RepID=UPI001C092A23|nr:MULTISPECIES: OmpA family protein [unclassified Colwellia]MBU2925504.1 OmpA family protein [Colwellia sp. C2M11]MDO6506462.1 OmpA family protein [Colwellia sp. 5_MG-2023]MDO6555286.1 OmpA family protein [Colwellia sp. 4_MG-2023]MDO6651528.1 OmpA family protein [Colwellia sp. 3_MG-2023]MDO6665074.1 OmpA family protein [Colwellia sp. 2_MG-2023]
MKHFTLPLIACLALSACSTFDPYTGEEKTTNTAKGAGIGAGVAAVVAYIANKDEDDIGKRNRRILQAATGGAAIGGGIGYYMDTQEAELRKQLRGSGVSVERDGNNINLIMPGNITFSSSKANIEQNFYSVLDSVVLVLKEFDKTLIVVAGHTDSSGSDALNQRLSVQRAQSVSGYLSAAGILNDRIESIGFGETQPVANNNTEAGKELNRRVEITLLPIAE